MMRMDPETGNLVRKGIPAILNPADVFPVSAAVSLKERFGGEVTLITMGPPAAQEALRECLAMGCDQAVLLTDRAFGNADTLATSYSIMMAAGQTGNYDVILCGKESLDGATGQMPAQLAQRFGAAMVTSCCGISGFDAEGGTLTAVRRTGNGTETVRAKLPVLLTVEKEAFPEIMPTLKGKIRALHAPVSVVTAKDIPGLDYERIGDPGSPTKVPRMFPPVVPEAGEILNSVPALLEKLREDQCL